MPTVAVPQMAVADLAVDTNIAEIAGRPRGDPRDRDPRGVRRTWREDRRRQCTSPLHDPAAYIRPSGEREFIPVLD